MKPTLFFKFLRLLPICFFLISICRLYPGAQDFYDDLTVFEAVIQGSYTDDYVYVLMFDGEFYVSPQQIAQATGITISSDERSGYWGNTSKKFYIDVQNGTAGFNGKHIKIDGRDFMEYGGQFFFTADFYQKLFLIHLDFDQRNLLIKIDSDESLPRIQASDMRKNSAKNAAQSYDSFNEYSFDKRLFAWPVLDFTLSKNWNKSGDHYSQSDSYAIDAGMLLLGMDADFHIFGNSYVNDRSPRMRATLSRIFLQEPGNFINLRNFQAGDILGTSGGFFTASTNGRGAQASSFKDFVTSADKTITLSGPLPEGWDAELYLNNQLISFRQPSFAGRYEFANIPVIYGLNNFKIVFYGPTGEIRFEEQRYYSGRSPVKAGELGYNISAYQQGRYLLESNEPFVNDSSALSFDSIGYYGIDDYITVMSGFTSLPDVEDSGILRQYGMLGGQLVLQGVSLQYNAQYGFENDSIGHHFDAQGNIKVADIMARYEYYGDLKSPISYQYNEYLKNLFEIRLSGIFPFISIPWYLSFNDMDSHIGNNYKTISARLSPNFYGYFFSLENLWERNSFFGDGDTNTLVFNMAKMFGIITTNLSASYETYPRLDWAEASARLDYRLDRNTFLSFGGYATNRTYSSLDNLLALRASCGKIFFFGALTLDTGVDSDNSLSATITYKISFAKNPYKTAVFTDAKTQLSNSGAIAVKAVDESSRPVKGIGVRAAGQLKPEITNDDGIAILTDMPTYAKTYLSVENEIAEDIALSAEKEKYKYVLRPGTILPLEIPFTHKGEIEGQIKLKTAATSGRKLLIGYLVQLRSTDGKIITQTYTDSEGYFILEPAPFGNYKVVVVKDGKDAAEAEISLNDIIFAMQEPLAI